MYCYEVLSFDLWMSHAKDLKNLMAFFSSLKEMDC